MNKTDLQQHACDARERRDPPSSSTQGRDVDPPARPALAVHRLARRPYVKPAFHHQIVFKQLLPKPDVRAAIDR